MTRAGEAQPALAQPGDPHSAVPIAEVLRDAPTNWGRWGDVDEVGALNFLGRAEVLAALPLVRSGETFTLQTPMADPAGDPVSPSRASAVRTSVTDQSSWSGPSPPEVPGGARLADDTVVAYLQGTTQCDALGHVWFDDTLWNGYPAEGTIGGLDRAGVGPLARRGIVGRAVLIDIARHRGKAVLDPGETFDHLDIEAAALGQGVELRPHDILLFRTGRLSMYYSSDRSTFHDSWPEPGLVYSPALARWFLDRETPAIGSDTIGIEVTLDPSSGAKLVVHNALMRNLGIVFVEICDLDAWATACAADGRWDALFVAAPLNVVGAAGAPVNPVVLR
jgi:kynurenine formamidase